ncbi:MAG: protein kinase [Gemmataceae bacterium]|nr:protein kinase [Gemmataceae bacterium]
MIMQLICGKCKRTLEFSGDRPSFCAFCGNALADTKVNEPSDPDPNAATLAAEKADTAEAAPVASIGGYRLLRSLGTGGMGSVYEAEEMETGRRVALKLISTTYASSPDAVDRFRQEGRIASMIAHPRCVFVLKVDDDAGRPYIAMELVEGSTLKDMVERKGPLPPEEAIAKMLDVIEGLQAAHRVEVIHRDVKPSNCFLEEDGRVKVGDFGLAKSLVKDSQITKTGAFVGTPHFASPEQVRGEAIDQQTDVYAVAATLFYLLTGHPPFAGSDPTATLARIVSDPMPSLRRYKPHLPAALDKVIQRGLERDRKQRYPDLEALRQALASLTPSKLSAPALALRGIAFAADCALLWLAALLLFGLWTRSTRPATLFDPVVQHGIGFLLFVAYFTLLESTAGTTLGKVVLRLRVCTRRWVDPPSLGAAALRALICGAGVWLGFVVGALLAWLTGAAWLGAALPWLWLAVGGGLLVSTMREQNNFRGWHELVSGTQVAQVSWTRQRQALVGSGGWLLSFLTSRRLKAGMPQLGQLPEKMAGFAIRGVLKWTPTSKILLGEDASLGRRVLIWMRPQSGPPLEPARRDVGRRTRLRWLASGKQGELQWDALLAPSGCPLPEFMHSEGRLEWSEARLLLEDLARELSAACNDSTVPRSLTPAQVWVQPDGRAQLADFQLAQDESTDGSASATGDDQVRGLALLQKVSTLLVEGGGADSSTGPMAIPPAAKDLFTRLSGGSEACFATVDAFLTEFSTVTD